ncbi:MAG: hypothetical protein JSV65_08505 [Armatimonadota bacterium]|nr:MAG: hypothetical protein JSV65_08505 [Armatimonadota bacterium]
MNGESTQSAIARRAAGMKRNYQAIDDLSADIKYEFHAGMTGVTKFRFRWSKPGKFLIEELASTPPSTGAPTPEPLERRAFDGKKLRIQREYPSSARVIFKVRGEVLLGDGTRRDMGAFWAADPRATVWGGERPRWDMLEEAAAAGRIARAESEKRFGGEGLAVVVRGGRRGGRGLEQYVWIDDAHGFIPRIWRATGNTSASAEVRVEAVEESGGVWFPVSVTQRMRHATGATSEASVSVTSLAINAGIPAATFEPAFAERAVVRDRTAEQERAIRRSEQAAEVSRRIGRVLMAGLILVAGFLAAIWAWSAFRRRRRPPAAPPGAR